MPWVKFTDDWYDDEGMADASPLAIAMWAVAITWSARNLTDGRIPRSQVRKLLDLEHDVVVGASCRADDIAAELVALGKWAASDRGYTIRNYHRYQPTREKVLADRAKDRQRKASRTVPDGIHPESDPDPIRNPGRPVPVPDGDLVLSSSPATHDAPGGCRDDEESSAAEVPSETWQHYAELKLQAELRQRPGSIRSQAKWKATTRANARRELADQALRWWRMFELTPRRLAECLVDGTAPRHARRRPEAS